MLSHPPRHLLDTSGVDPSGMPPLCGEDEFADLIHDMVAESTPRLFAIVQEYGERVDAHVAAWGLWFGDRAITVTDDGRTMIMRSVESALRLFCQNPYHTPHVYWPALEPARDPW